METKNSQTGGGGVFVDAFLKMVTATAETELKLSEFHPRSQLRVRETLVETPSSPAIDFHNHLDSQSPTDVLRVMDECGIELIVNITMRLGAEGIEMLHRYRNAAANRFATIAWMDWSGLEGSDFPQVAAERLERLVDSGMIGIKLWKDLGTSVRDGEGNLLRVDDERLDLMYDKARELGIPVMFHTADPAAFFDPVDGENERFEELAAHPEWSFVGSEYGKRALLEQRNHVFARHPGTTFVCAHMGESPEDLDLVDEMLLAYPNVHLDFSARVAELGRQPRRTRSFFIQHQDRILFGTDLLPSVDMYRAHYRFLETADEYFDYPSHASRQGRWKIYGLDLPQAALQSVYRENAARLLKLRP